MEMVAIMLVVGIIIDKILKIIIILKKIIIPIKIEPHSNAITTISNLLIAMVNIPKVVKIPFLEIIKWAKIKDLIDKFHALSMKEKHCCISKDNHRM